ncbi:MAG: tRNA (adenosine(37)-N6)-dimethylallyltransferase MiaA [bacterium]|nr:tRNA (adenosine(37)-N6)-dimethylallyltransferase MiaA [bacterium]
MQALPLVIALMGPTASGKSALAMSLAKEYGAEIISADSAQVYRQVSVGTAKPSAAELREVPHHLIDIRDLGQGFCLADFQKLATQAVQEIWQRGRIPLVAGGTGLYVRGLLEGYALEAPPPDEELRASLNERDLPSLLAELAERDPAAFQAIDRCNKRRVSRALEIILQTGKSWTECSRRQPPPWRILKFGLVCEREILRERIRLRLQRMLADGWVEEVTSLLSSGWEESLRSANILGYAQVIDFVQERISAEQMREEIFVQTSRFAKRQRTWLRAEPGLMMYPASEEGWEDIRQRVRQSIDS